MSTSRNPYRPPSNWEMRVILRLLERPFPGRDELLAQAEDLAVRPIDENGSLKLKCSKAGRACVKRRVPVEGAARDVDGMVIHYLLHVVDGMMDELEVYKDDSSRVVQHAVPEDLDVMSLD